MQNGALEIHQQGRPTFSSQQGVGLTACRFTHQEKVTGQVPFGTCVGWSPGRQNSGRRPRLDRDIESETGKMKLWCATQLSASGSGPLLTTDETQNAESTGDDVNRRPT